jgi:N-acetylmuramoyl-L-alanine amidase
MTVLNICSPMFQNVRVPIFGILMVWLLGAPSIPTLAAEPLFDAYKQIIVLDPGHGGHEIGARGAGGAEEKTVALALARLISAELRQDYKVKLTRSDDYHVDLANRTALANHLKAAVLISLHTGGSFAYSTAGPRIYYHQMVTESVSDRRQSVDLQSNNHLAATPWDRVQTKYLESSRVLARTVSSHLSNLNHFKNIPVQGAPMAVLQGAQMPAILIEIGYLTNPTEESNLRNDRYLKDIATKISLGIETFLSRLDKMSNQ